MRVLSQVIYRLQHNVTSYLLHNISGFIISQVLLERLNDLIVPSLCVVMFHFEREGGRYAFNSNISLLRISDYCDHLFMLPP